MTRHYSGHSFRRDAATWAKQAGIPDSDIQLLGRWKSDAYKRYIEVHPEHIWGVSHRPQTFSPPPHRPPQPTVSPPAVPTGPRGNRGSRGRRVGVLGRAGRGAGEPGPASRAASASGIPQRGPGRDRPAPRARGGVWACPQLPAGRILGKE